MRHPDYAFWSVVSLLAVLLPAPWHFKAGNIPTMCLIVWLGLANTVLLINSIIWAGNYADISPIWCDISSRIITILSDAVILCSFTQMRRLALVATRRVQPVNPNARLRARMLEVFLCALCPLLLLPVQYVFQGHRYDIIENLGPVIPDFLTWPTIVVRYMLPVAICLASLVYAGIAMYAFFKHRAEVKHVLRGTAINSGRYMRLAGLAVVDCFLCLFCTLFLLIGRFAVYHDLIMPYKSWKFVHSNFSLVSQFPEEAHSAAAAQIVIPIYTGHLYAFFFFAFFGFGEESIKVYFKIWRRLKAIAMCRAPDVSNVEPAAPNLGSTVMSLNGAPWVEANNAFSNDVADNHEKNVYDNADAGSGKRTTRGITVDIERSIV